MKLSIYLPVHNEEHNLEDVLSNASFADEIVVLLDKCTDRSKEIAQSFSVKILEGSWDKEGPRRNDALAACTGDWILEMDADERITPELAQEIRQVIENSTHDLYKIPFDNYIGDRLVKYGWGAYIGVSNKIALFRNGAKTYLPDGRVTHAEPVMNGTFGPMLQNAIIHYLDKDFSDTLKRFDNYTKSAAKDLLYKQENGGSIGSFGRNFIRIFSRFYKSYIRRKGYREGSLGFLIGVLAGLYPMVSYIKAKYKI